MYDYLIATESKVVKDFAEKNLKTLLFPLKGNTGLSIDIMSPEKLKERSLTYTINTAEDCKKIGNEYENNLVIYSFTTKEINMEETYIGLSQNLINRLEVHYYLSNNKEKQYGKFYPFCFEKGGMKNLYFNIHLFSPTFLSLYLKENQYCTPELRYILQAFSEFKAGIIEQAFFSFYKPGLNKTHLTRFNFLNWRPGLYSKIVAYSYFNQPSSIQKLSNINLDKFDFSVYFELCAFLNIEPMTQEWLEWFVGFIERRGKSQSHFHTNNLKLGMKDKEFLFYLKSMLSLTSSPFFREKVGYQLDLGNQYDLDILFSIFNKNLMTNNFNIHFDKVFSNKYKNLFVLTPAKAEDKILSDSKLSLNNGWLSGFIDANCSMMFDNIYPVINITLSNDYEMLVKISELFPNNNIINNKTTIKFKGLSRVRPVLQYLEKYPPKLKFTTYLWFLECIRLIDLKYQLKNETKEILKTKILSRPE